MFKAAVLIDGGYLRALAKKARRNYDPDYIEKIALACVAQDETLLRILYYDCAPYNGTARLPVSGGNHRFVGSDAWLKQLAQKELFAVRQGVLKFRGFKPKRVPIAGAQLTDADFKADFEQKGVDMRIGLDIAHYSTTRAVDRLILASGDTDCVPAMKHARKAGLQVVIVQLANCTIASELLSHSDFKRHVTWPAP